MTDIPIAKIIDSNIEYKGEMKQCLSIIIEPYPKTVDEIMQLGDDLRTCVQRSMNL